jgi:hypothetical protein
MSFKHIHEDNMREANLQKSEAERPLHLASLKRREADLEAEIARVQDLTNLSQLRDQLVAIRDELARVDK